MSITANVKNEFWFHVSNQDEIPIFGMVDKGLDIDLLVEIIEKMPNDEREELQNRQEELQNRQIEYLLYTIQTEPNTIDILRALVGITDKRMYLELSYIFGKARFDASDEFNILNYPFHDLKKHGVNFFKGLTQFRKKDEKSVKARQERQRIVDISTNIITEYLVGNGLIGIIVALKKLEKEEIEVLVDSLILPSENQQAEAKRRGHGAEWRLASVLNELGISFLPIDRHINPMSSDDPNVDKETFQLAPKDEEEDTTWSFDLIIPEQTSEELRIFVQGLVHTSDPGQYGVNKSNETVTIKQELQDYNQRNSSAKELWGLVDGVGFIENPKKTIFKMLDKFDCFVQLKSLYKAGLRLHKLGIVKISAIRFDMDFYSASEATEMYHKYASTDIQLIINETIPSGKEIKAGKAWLYV